VVSEEMTTSRTGHELVTDTPIGNDEGSPEGNGFGSHHHRSKVDVGLPFSNPPQFHGPESIDSDVSKFNQPRKQAAPLNRSNSIDNADITRAQSRFDDDESLNSETLQTEGITGSSTGERLVASMSDLVTILQEEEPNIIATDVLAELKSPLIDDNTPAAEALRANRGVKVPKMVKVARSLHAQSVRRFIKRATLRAKSGNRRGKPPRIPPNHQKGNTNSNDIYVLDEGDESAVDEENEMDSSIESVEEGRKTVSASKTSKDLLIESEVVIGNIEDLEPKKNRSQAENVRHLLEQLPGMEVLAGTMETGKKILASSDPHDIIQNQRWRRRKKSRRKQDCRKSYVKGKVIDGQHELYALSIAVMLGVRTSIGTTNAQMTADGRRWLTSDDFMATEKYEFKPSGGTLTPPHQLGHTFKFKDYSPIAFAYLRRMFGVNEFDFLLSVCGNANFIEFISNAKSGQFFFYSSDGKYMVKTMTNAESKFLRRILPHYFRHCSQNPNTLMTKFLGMHRVKIYHLRRNVKFVIMNSVYYTDKILQSFYDLKGSVTGRDSKPGQDVKKDNDLRRGLPDTALALPPDVRHRLRDQVLSDCSFMRRMKIMDYSMLVGIHHTPPKKGISSDRSPGNTGFRFSLERKETSRTVIRDAIKRTSITSPSQPSTTTSVPSAGDASNLSGPTYQGSVQSKLSVNESSLSGYNSFPENPKSAASSKSNPNLTMHATDKDDVSTIGGYSKASEDHSFSMYDFALEDDDDNSYLEGSGNLVVTQPPMSTATLSKMAELEMKKEQTVENVYWPFHRYYDLNGYRRMHPCRCTQCGHLVPCPCDDDNGNIRGFKIPDFVLPVSDRKDGGLTMDTSGFKMPMKFKGPSGRDQLYDGKIFYMGIIDILQQYNIRKRIEARYRRLKGSGWQDASCVHPVLYAERFVRFFDEYSQRVPSSQTNDMHLEEGEEAILFQASVNDEEAKEEINPSLSDKVLEGDANGHLFM